MAQASTIPFQRKHGNRNGRNGKPAAVRGVRGSKPPTQKEDDPTADAGDLFIWSVSSGARKNYGRLGRRLSQSVDLYRNGANGLGLIQVLPNGETRLIAKGGQLAPIIADRLNLVVMKEDNHVCRAFIPRKGDDEIRFCVEQTAIADHASPSAMSLPISGTGEDLDATLLSPVTSEPVSAPCISVDQQGETLFLVEPVEHPEQHVLFSEVPSSGDEDTHEIVRRARDYDFD